MSIAPQRFAALNGRLSCLAAGPAEGAGVLLIHGLGWDAARLWGAQIGALAAAGWRVLAPDLRGTGASAPLRAPVSIPDFAADLAALLAETGMDRPVLVGFSMGCMTAVDLALRADTRAPGVVLACGGLTATAEGAAAVEAMIARARTLGPRTFAEEQAGAVFGPHYRATQPEAVAAFIRWRAAMDQESLHHAFRAPRGLDYAPRLPELATRVAVIAADTDAFLPLASARDLAEAARAPLHVIAGSGHMAPVERPDEFSGTLLGAISEVTS